MSKIQISDYTADWIRICKHGTQEGALFTSSPRRCQRGSAPAHFESSPILSSNEQSSTLHYGVCSILLALKINLYMMFYSFLIILPINSKTAE